MITVFKMVMIEHYLIGILLILFFIVAKDHQKYQMKIYQIYTQEEFL